MQALHLCSVCNKRRRFVLVRGASLQGLRAQLYRQDGANYSGTHIAKYFQRPIPAMTNHSIPRIKKSALALECL
jgi:hypothetical protein